MRKWYVIAASACVAAVLVSCATVKPAEPAVEIAAPVVETPEPEPVMIEVPYWVLNRIETAYPDGILSGVETFELDETGRILVNTIFDGKNAITAKKTWTWSADGATLAITDANGELVGKGQQRWKDGLLGEDVRMNVKNEPQSTERYEYDAEGRKVRWSVQTAQGSTVTTDYGWENGKLTVIAVKDATGATIKRFVRAYDASGAMVSEEEYDSKGIVARKIAYTNENGFPVLEEIRNGTGGMISSIRYTNDEHGNPVKVDYLDRTGRLIETRTQAWTGFTRLVRQK